VVVTPREERFGKLAVESGILTRSQLDTLVKFETQKQVEGTSLTLWETAVLNKMMDAGMADKLLDEVGELDVEKLGEFRLLRPLGRGGMGSVWLAETPERKKVAVKVLHSSFAGNRSFLSRFFREAQASIKLEHKNIVRGLDVGESNGHYYFAMEYVEGRSVQSILDKEGAFQPQRAAEIILDVAEALVYAHEHNTIHRDIKPDNIMLTSGGHAKLADLGLARVSQEGLTQLTETGTTMGTPTYMAPEQCTDAKRADARSDIYSLGATWYHMIVGRPPFDGSTALEVMQKHLKDPLRWPPESRTSVPRGVMLAIQRMMGKRPEARFQTMKDVVQTIKEQCLGGRDVFKELGVERGARETAVWYLKTVKGGKEKIVRVTQGKLLQMIRWGKISPDVLACRAGEQGLFLPIRKIPALVPSLPTMAPRQPGKGGARRKAHPVRKPAARSKAHHSLHDYIEHYDEYERRRRRKKALIKLGKAAVTLLILAAIAGALFLGYKHLWPRISQSINSSSSSEAGGGP